MDAQAITAAHVVEASNEAGCNPSELFDRAANWRRLTPAHAAMAHRHYDERKIVARFMGDFISGGHHQTGVRAQQ